MLVSHHLRWLLCALLGIAALPVHADLFYAPPAPQEDAPKMSGEAELGYTHLSGNSNSRTLLAKGRLTWLTGRHTHTLRGETRSVPSHSCGRVSSSLRIFSACVALSNGECTSHATAASAPHVAVKPVLPTDCGTQWPCSCECRGLRPNTLSPW